MERIVQVLTRQGRVLRSALGHQKDDVAILWRQEFAVALFAATVLVDDRGIKESNTPSNGGLNHLLGFGFARPANVRATQPEHCDHRACLSELALREQFTHAIARGSHLLNLLTWLWPAHATWCHQGRSHSNQRL